MRRGLSLLWVVLTLVIAAVVGVVSYQAGVSTQLPAGAVFQLARLDRVHPELACHSLQS